MLAHADEVWVITRANNKLVIESHPLSQTAELHFIYYDLPRWAVRLKKKFWFPRLYFALWQWGAYRMAAKFHHEKPFDCVYHATFAGILSGSFMGRLGIPFIIGPIGGGERAPFRLRRSMSIRSQLSELLRDFGILLQRYSPLTLSAFAAAERIYVTTPESMRLVLPRWHKKTSVQLSFGICRETSPHYERELFDTPRFVFVGRLIHWKGAHFAIRALAEARKKVPAATLTLFTGGPDEQWLRNIANQAGVVDAVEFAGHVPSRQQLMDSLSNYTALVFPSLHDSGGMVVLEALSKGLPAVCLDLGGLGVIVNESCGIVIPTFRAKEEEIVTRIANAMISLAIMSAKESARLSIGAVTRANELSWVSLTERIARA